MWSKIKLGNFSHLKMRKIGSIFEVWETDFGSLRGHFDLWEAKFDLWEAKFDLWEASSRVWEAQIRDPGP